MASNSSEGDTTFYIILFCFFGGIIYWIFQSGILAFPWKWIRLAELTPFYFMPSWMPLWGDLEVQKAWHFLYKTPADQIHHSTMIKYDESYPRWFRWVFMIPLIIYGLKLIRTSESVSASYDVESLLRKWSGLYPHLERFVDNDPNKKPRNYRKGNKESYIYGIALTPDEFAKLSPPLGLEKEAKLDSSLRHPIWGGGNDFDTDLADRAFKSQLGNLYTSVEDMPSLERKCFDLLMSKVMMPEDELYELIKTVIKDNLTTDSKKVFQKNYSGYGYDEFYDYVASHIENLKNNKYPSLLKKAKAGKENSKTASKMAEKMFKSIAVSDNTIQDLLENKTIDKLSMRVHARRVMESHAYVYTGLMALLTEARKTGVVSVYAELHFVRPLNRTLWFAFQSTGRNTAFVEAAGVMAHYLIEDQIGRPLRQGEVTEAVEGLKISLRITGEEEAALSSNYQL